MVLVLVKDSALRRLTSLGLVSLAAAALSAAVGMPLFPIAEYELQWKTAHENIVTVSAYNAQCTVVR